MKLVLRVFIILCLITISLLPSMASAATYAQPDTDNFLITNAYAYQNLQEDGDQLYLAQYSIGYTTPADAPAWVGEAYLGEFSNGGAVYGSIQPWGYFNASGEIQWFYGIYFTASQVASIETAIGTDLWENANNRMQLSGNPSLFWDGGTAPLASLTGVIYNPATDSDTVLAALTSRLRTFAAYYENLSEGTLDLINEIGGILKLTTDGDTYFSSTLSALRNLIPDLFSDYTEAPEFTQQELITDFYNDVADTNAYVNGTNYMAQTFTPEFQYDISGMQFRGLYVSSPGVLTGSLRATAAGLPTGADLVSGTINTITMSDYALGEWYEIVFDDDYTLTAGTTYALVLSNTGGSTFLYVSSSGTGTPYAYPMISSSGTAHSYLIIGSSAGAIGISWRDDSTGSFTGGQRCTSGDSGATWTANTGHDLMFSIISRDGSTMVFAERDSTRLEESGFGITGLAGYFGLSNNWMGTVLWLIIAVAMVIAAVWVTKDNRVAFSVFMFMMPIGWLTGFLYYQVAIAFTIICAIVIVYSFFYRPASE